MKNRRMKVLLLAAGVAFAISGIALAEDAYIQASGAQTINTGYFVNSKTVLEIDFALTSGDTSKTVFGGIDGSGTSCCLWSNGNGSLEPRLGSWCGGMVRSSTTRYTAKFDLPNRKVELYEHGATSPVATKDDTTQILDNGKSDRPLMLFAMGKSTYGWTNTDYGSCRIYSFKATEDGVTVLDWRPCVLDLCQDMTAAPEKHALAFHANLAEALAASAVMNASRFGIETVALSGGCWQNSLLLDESLPKLRKNGLRVLTHSLLSPNDECVSVGQAYVAGMRLAAQAK